MGIILHDGKVVLAGGNALKTNGSGGGAASQEELDGIAGKVGGIETPSTPESIEAQADVLIEDANDVTGESDETLTDAIASLIAGKQYPDEYVTDGLYFCLDAVNNAGDHHDANAESWIDTIGGIEFEAMDDAPPEFGENYVYFLGGNHRLHNTTDALSLAEPEYCEFVCQVTDRAASQVILQRADGTTSGNAKNGSAVYQTTRDVFTNSMSSGNRNEAPAIRGKVTTFGGTLTDGVMRNGKLTWNTGNGSSYSNSQSDFIIGGYKNNTYPLKDYLCAVRYYNRRLTDDEIMQNYLQDVKRYGAGKPVDTSGGEDDPPRTIISADDLDVSDVVSYFQSPVVDAVRHMEDLGDGWTHFAAITDTHYNKNFRHSADMLAALYDCGRIERVIFLGDMDDGYDADGYANFKADYGDLFESSLFVLGNHDQKIVTAATWYSDVFSQMSRAKFGSTTKLYYHIDFPSKGIRLICCNGNDTSQAQKDWAKAVLKNAPSNYTCFIIQHQTFFPSSIGALPYGGLKQTIDPVVLAAEPRFGAILCGHLHNDDTVVSDEGVRQDVLLSDGWINDYHSASTGGRVDGTNTAQAITIISINTEQKKIQFYRIGARDSTSVTWADNCREVSYDRTETEA